MAIFAANVGAQHDAKTFSIYMYKVNSVPKARILSSSLQAPDLCLQAFPASAGFSTDAPPKSVVGSVDSFSLVGGQSKGAPPPLVNSSQQFTGLKECITWLKTESCDSGIVVLSKHSSEQTQNIPEQLLHKTKKSLHASVMAEALHKMDV